MNEHFDVLIAGAGISGVGAAYHLTTEMAHKSFVVLENQESFGGTWLTHKYPGIRSDSDLFTFGYRFKPWEGPAIATADEILDYMGEVIDENDLAQHIRYNHTINNASWSSKDHQWTIEATKAPVGSDGDGQVEDVTITAGFLWMCQGYYRHSEGYTPEWEGMDDFEGTIVHPQTWPDDLDYTNRNIVVIGSGATAATLIPAIADRAGHVTMLQRSPTYFATKRRSHELAEELRELDLPPEWIHEIVRRKVLFESDLIVEASRDYPDLVKDELLGGIKEYLGEDYELSPHFTPSYRPWRQRIAFVPNGDLFTAVAEGKASVATDHIDRFTAKGIKLESGEELAADIIVTATGFDLLMMGGIAFFVDGEPVDFAQTVGWRGTMFTGVPNMSLVFGYFRASWTLRVDILADFMCRLLAHMEANDCTTVVPNLGPDEEQMELQAWVLDEDFNPGYIMRSLSLLPKQGDRQPWLHTQNYKRDAEELPKADLDDGSLAFS